MDGRSLGRGFRVGFTLVELLVVVAIMVLLIALLLPALNKARNAAKAVRCASNLQQVYLLESEYATEFEGWIGYNLLWNGTWGGWQNFLLGGDSQGPPWTSAYPISSVYCNNPNLLACPFWGPGLFPAHGEYPWAYGMNSDAPGPFSPPWPGPTALPQTKFVPWQLGYRDATAAANGDPYFMDASLGKIRFLSLSRAEAPGTGVMFADSVYPNVTFGAVPYSQPDMISVATWSGGENSTYASAIHLRHNQGANLLFWDGHAARYDAGALRSIGCGAWVTENMNKYP